MADEGLTREELAVAREADRLLSRHDFADFDVRSVPAYQHEPTSLSKGREQEFFERAVSAAWMAHTRGKGISPGSIASEDSDLPVARLAELVGTPRFKAAMRSRGLPAADLKHLTPEMTAALRVLSDHSLRSTTRERLHDLGIMWSEYQGWLDFRPFRTAHDEMMKRTLRVATELGDRVLASKIEDGDLNAIKYANEYTGRFVPGTQQQASVGYVMGMVLSILQRNVTDPALLQSLVGELMGLATGHGIPVAPPLAIESTPLEQYDLVQHAEPESGAGSPGDERALLDSDGQR